jgi:hypothetical protein
VTEHPQTHQAHKRIGVSSALRDATTDTAATLNPEDFTLILQSQIPRLKLQHGPASSAMKMQLHCAESVPCAWAMVSRTPAMALGM